MGCAERGKPPVRGEGAVFVLGRQLAEDQQPGYLKEVGSVRELLDGDAPVAQDALFAIDKGDGALATAGVAVAGVEGDQTAVGTQPGHVYGAFAFGTLDQGQFIAVVADEKGCFLGHGLVPGWGLSIG